MTTVATLIERAWAVGTTGTRTSFSELSISLSSTSVPEPRPPIPRLWARRFASRRLADGEPEVERPPRLPVRGGAASPHAPDAS